LRESHKKTKVIAIIDVRKAAPPRPAPRPIASVLDDCATLLLFGVTEVVGLAEELDVVVDTEDEEEVVDAVEDTEDEEEAVDTSTAVVLRKKTPCSFWQHVVLSLPQHQLPSSHCSN
jgi:hypothetical protein